MIMIQRIAEGRGWFQSRHGQPDLRHGRSAGEGGDTGPVGVILHLRDSVVYESRNGIAVQWVPLGEGVIDFKKIIASAR